MHHYFTDGTLIYAFAADGSEDHCKPAGLRQLTPAEVEAHLNPPTAQPKITVVSMRQARRAMLRVGILDQVQAVIDSLPEEQAAEARIDWEFSTDVRRDWPLVVALGPALGLTDEQIDDLFTLASTF